MCKLDVVRAWKDEDYRMSLSEAERRMLPTNPAGLVEISDSELGVAGGGTGIDFGGGSIGVCSAVFGACQSAWMPVCSGCLGPCGGTGGFPPFGSDGFCPVLPGDVL